MIDDLKAFSRFVAQAFSARRKTLRNVFKTELTAADFDQAEVDSQRRAQTLELSEFVRLFDACRASNPSY